MSRLCSGQPVFVGNHSSVLWARAWRGGRVAQAMNSQNALLSDVPPSKTYRHSRGEWWWVGYRSNGGVFDYVSVSVSGGGEDKDAEFVCVKRRETVSWPQQTNSAELDINVGVEIKEDFYSRIKNWKLKHKFVQQKKKRTGNNSRLHIFMAAQSHQTEIFKKFCALFYKSSLTYLIFLEFKIKFCEFEQHFAAQ